MSSKEGTTQGDLKSTGTDASGVTPLLHLLYEFILINEHRKKEVVFGDDLIVAGKIEEIKQYRELLLQKWVQNTSCYLKPSKSRLIMKEEHFGRVLYSKIIFKGSEVKITKSGQRNLGAAIGKKEFEQEYIESMVNNWSNQLISLSIIAEMEHQAEYMQLLLEASKVSLHIFFEQLLIFMHIFHL